MSDERQPMRIGIDLSRLGQSENVERLSHCGGALLRVNESEAQRFEAEKKMRFSADNPPFVENQRIDLRVHCSNNVDGRLGLCSYCSGLEATNRRWLREALAPKRTQGGPGGKFNAEPSE